MPTYEYACRNCGHTFETFQSMKEPPLVDCPSCGQPKLQRLIGVGAGIIFKGSGFYETDYKKPGNAKANGNGSASEGAKGSDKAESKGTPAKESAGASASGSGGAASKPASDGK